MIHPFGVTGFNRLTALSVANDNPAKASRPFDNARGGFVLGEGAAAVLLESADHATARGARGYAQLAGYGVASDAAHLADPSSEGQSRAMALALDDAALDPGDVGYINAHGTATSAGDRAETRSIKRVFGEHARSTAVSSTKAVHGHAMGAAGALEFVIALMALHHRAVPPTAHLRRPDPELDLDFVAHGGRHDVDLEAVMSNSFAFGGTNAVLAARRCPPALSRA
jgi:3-oxoacyl-[acyl-carrier-protein] synthase II